MKSVVTILIVLVAVILFVFYVGSWISVDQATARFAELAQVPQSEIVVVRHSNNNFVLGNPNDVVFELQIRNKPVSGRCTSDIFSPMVCRLYEGG